MNLKRLFSFTLLIVLMLSSCISDLDYDMEKVDRIEYRFGDSSVPPPHHRSYSIVVSETEISIVVDSYGDVVNSKKIKSDGSHLKLMKEDFVKYEINKGPEVKDDGCSGGTTESIYCYQGEEEVFSAWVYHCANRDGGNLKGNIEAYADSFNALIPNLSKELE